MRTMQCDGCQKTLHKGTDVYYSIREMDKHMPQQSSRVYFSHSTPTEKTELTAEPMGWVSYEDLDYCQECIQKPIDIAPHFRKRESE